MFSKILLILFIMTSSAFAGDNYATALKQIKSGQFEEGYKNLEESFKGQKEVQTKVTMAKILAQAEPRFLKVSPLIYGLFASDHIKTDTPEAQELYTAIADQAFNEGKLFVAEEYYKKALSSAFVTDKAYLEFQFVWVLANLKKYDESLAIIEKNLTVSSDYRIEFVKIYGRFWLEAKFYQGKSNELKNFSASDKEMFLEGFQKGLSLFSGEKAKSLLKEISGKDYFETIVQYAVKNLTSSQKSGDIYCNSPLFLESHSRDFYITLHECLPVMKKESRLLFLARLEMNKDSFKHLLSGNLHRLMENREGFCQSHATYFSKEDAFHSLYGATLEAFLSKCDKSYFSTELQNNLFTFLKNHPEQKGALLSLMARTPDILNIAAKDTKFFITWNLEQQIQYLTQSGTLISHKLELLSKVKFDMNLPEWRKVLFSLLQNQADQDRILAFIDSHPSSRNLNNETVSFLMMTLNQIPASENNKTFLKAKDIIRGMVVAKGNAEETFLVHLKDKNFEVIGKNMALYETFLSQNTELARMLIPELMSLDPMTVKQQDIKQCLIVFQKVKSNSDFKLSAQDLKSLKMFGLDQEIQFLKTVNDMKIPEKVEIEKLAVTLGTLQNLQKKSATLKWSGSWTTQLALSKYNENIQQIMTLLESSDQEEYKNLSKELASWKLQAAQS